MVTQLTSTSVRVKRKKSTVGREQLRELFCRCSKSCEPGEIHPVMLRDLAEAVVDQKLFSLRPEKMAKQVFRYKQEKEEEISNIR